MDLLQDAPTEIADAHVPLSLAACILHASNDAVALLDLAGTIRRVNPAWRQALGDAAVGSDWERIWSEPVRRDAADAVTRARDGLTTQFTGDCLTASGEPRWFNVTVGPSYGDDRRLTRIVVQARDVTDFVVNERELNALLQRNCDAVEALSQRLDVEWARLAAVQADAVQAERIRFLSHFISNLANDLNNVLTVLEGAHQHTNRGLSSRLVAGRALDRGSEIGRQLYQLSQAAPLDPDIIHIAAWLPELASLLRNALPRDVRLGVEVTDDCWPVAADRSQLEAVFLGLVRETCGAAGSGRLTIGARNCRASERPPALAAGDYVQFWLRLDGDGTTAAPPADASSPGEAAVPAAPYAGLGIVRSRSGSLDLSSFYLPRAPVRGAAIGAVTPLIDIKRHGDATVLIVDGDQFARVSLAKMLTTLGYRVIEAADAGVAAARIAGGSAVQLAIIDLQTDRDAALRLAERLRQASPAIPCLLLSDCSVTTAPPGELTFRKPVYEPLLARAILEKLGRKPVSIYPAEAMRAADRVRDRIRGPQVRAVFDNWRSALADGLRLPGPEQFDDLVASLADSSCLIEVLADDGDAPAFRVLRAGRVLIDRLGRDFTGERFALTDREFAGSLGNAYRRATRGAAHVDYARLPGEHGRMLLFERLILPLSADGQGVTHLLSIATFGEIALGVEGTVECNR